MSRTSTNQGYVFNIQHYSLHDGPGIRTIVFLKGCPLRCKWCSNPESQVFHPEISFNKSKCMGIDHCSLCVDACHVQAIETTNHQITMNRAKCDNCQQCAAVCAANALNTYGQIITVDQILNIVEKDSSFYSRSRGGLTLSGGEPLAQGEFALSILKEAKKRYINTTIETCGLVEWNILNEASTYLDNVLFDIKCINREKHQAFTGVYNELILENLEKLCVRYPDLKKIVRVPIIPGFNDSKEEIDEIHTYVKKHLNVDCEFLPYHQFGISKYEFLGRTYPLGNLKLGDEILTYIAYLNSPK